MIFIKPIPETEIPENKCTPSTDYIQDLFRTMCSLPEESSDNEYEHGLNDAWDLLKAVCSPTDELSAQDLQEIFDVPQGKRASYWILNNYTPQEALAKVKAYKEKREKLKVGDVVFVTPLRVNAVVTKITETRIDVLTSAGQALSYKTAYNLKKTGKHVDIQYILSEL